MRVNREEGVSAVVGTILMIVVVTMVASTVIGYVDSTPRPTVSQMIDISPNFSITPGWIYENLSFKSGSPLNPYDTFVTTYVNGKPMYYPLSMDYQGKIYPGSVIQVKLINTYGGSISSFFSYIFSKSSNSILWESSVFNPSNEFMVLSPIPLFVNGPPWSINIKIFTIFALNSFSGGNGKNKEVNNHENYEFYFQWVDEYSDNPHPSLIWSLNSSYSDIYNYYIKPTPANGNGNEYGLYPIQLYIIFTILNINMPIPTQPQPNPNGNGNGNGNANGNGNDSNNGG